MITFVDRDHPRVLKGGERVYHVQARRWGLVERVSTHLRCAVLVRHSMTESRAYRPGELLYAPNDHGPAYPCIVEAKEEDVCTS